MPRFEFWCPRAQGCARLADGCAIPRGGSFEMLTKVCLVIEGSAQQHRGESVRGRRSVSQGSDEGNCRAQFPHPGATRKHMAFSLAGSTVLTQRQDRALLGTPVCRSRLNPRPTRWSFPYDGRRRERPRRAAIKTRSPALCASKPSQKDWEELIWEFEDRARDSRSQSTPGSAPTFKFQEQATVATDDDPEPPQGRPLGRLNPKIEEVRPLTECAALAAGTCVLWTTARLLRLDAFVMLFYPLPCLFATMRHGPHYGNMACAASLLLILVQVGPLFGFSYTCSTGLLTVVFANALWRQVPWHLTLALGAIAKLVGFCAQIALAGSILRYNPWNILVGQVAALITTIGKWWFGLLRLGTFSGPTLAQVNIGMITVLALHSIFHVTFTHMSATLILDRYYDEGRLKRRPPLVPFLNWLKRAARRQASRPETTDWARVTVKRDRRK